VPNIKERPGAKRAYVSEPIRHKTYHWYPRVNGSESQQNMRTQSCGDSGNHPIHIATEFVDEEAQRWCERRSKDVDHAKNDAIKAMKAKIQA